MKTELVSFARDPRWVRALRSRTAVWMATVTLGAGSAFVLNAAVIDDFADGVKFTEGGGNWCWI